MAEGLGDAISYGNLARVNQDRPLTNAVNANLRMRMFKEQQKNRDLLADEKAARKLDETEQKAVNSLVYKDIHPKLIGKADQLIGGKIAEAARLKEKDNNGTYGQRQALIYGAKNDLAELKQVSDALYNYEKQDYKKMPQEAREFWDKYNNTNDIRTISGQRGTVNGYGFDEKGIPITNTKGYTDFYKNLDTAFSDAGTEILKMNPMDSRTDHFKKVYSKEVVDSIKSRFLKDQDAQDYYLDQNYKEIKEKFGSKAANGLLKDDSEVKDYLAKKLIKDIDNYAATRGGELIRSIPQGDADGGGFNPLTGLVKTTISSGIKGGKAEPVFDANGKPVIDPATGRQKFQRVGDQFADYVAITTKKGKPLKVTLDIAGKPTELTGYFAAPDGKIHAKGSVMRDTGNIKADGSPIYELVSEKDVVLDNDNLANVASVAGFSDKYNGVNGFVNFLKQNKKTPTTTAKNKSTGKKKISGF